MSHDKLRECGTVVYLRLGMAEADAELAALVQAGLGGRQSHDVMRLS